MNKETKIACGIFLALVLAFSLAGVSYYFPASYDAKSVVFELVSGEIPTQQGNYTVYMIINLPNITITEDGTINPPDAHIQRVENVYTLSEDIINQTLRIQRDNIVVDGADHKVQGALNAAGGVFLENVNNVTLKSLEVTQFWFGISLINCSNITINGNRITDIGSRAITIVSSNDITISDNTVNSSSTAIEFTSSNGFLTNSTVTGNTITNAAQGITIGGSFCTITENNLGNIHLPIGVTGNYTSISKNNLVNGIGGIYLTGSHCKIYGNNLANFSESGITINRGTNCSIYENSLSNSKCAIILRNYEDTWIIESNTFYHNNFINNTQSVSVELPSHHNVWDNGSEGNYWSTYDSTDSNGDGIGDTEHEIDENNIDRYPLMSPYEIEQTTNMLFVYLGIIGLVAFAAVVIALMWINKRKDS